MLRIVFVLLASVLFLPSCQTMGTSPATVADLDSFDQKIVGTWVSQRKIKNYYARVEKTYFPDGTAKGSISSYAVSNSVKLYLPNSSFKSRWKRKGNVLLVYDIRWDDGETTPSEIHHDKIVSISDSQFIFIDDPTKQRVVANKIK